MADLSIEKFSPSVAELQELVKQSAGLMLTNPKDKELLKKIKAARLLLKNARVNITKTGKALREDALEFGRAVISKEKSLVAIIEPEEDRLAAMEDAVKKIQDRENRREFLPRRHERLNALNDGIAVTDDELLDMDGSAFEGYFNQRSFNQNEKVRLANEESKRKNDEIAAKLAQEEETRRREDIARQEGEARAKKAIEDQKAEDERKRIEQETNENNLRLQRERSERYQEWLKKNGWTIETKDQFNITDELGKIVLWKKVDVFSG